MDGSALRIAIAAAAMTQANQIAPLQDEVYRQMLRLDSGCTAASLPLALALLRAWMVIERVAPRSRERQWLRTVCPVCLRLIATSAATRTRAE